jgi:hypothetical protein
VKIDAVFAGQAGEVDAELAQLGRRHLERGGVRSIIVNGLPVTGPMSKAA